MSDFSEVSHEGWFSRIMGSIKGVVVGLLLFIAGMPFLWWNEGRAVTTYNSLNEGLGAVVEGKADALDPALDKKLVHIVGDAKSTETLSDSAFGVSVPNGIRLERNVKMYQWKENKKTKKEKKLGGGKKTVTTYSYEKDWSSSVIDSSRFKKSSEYRNPSKMAFSPVTKQANKVTFGAFTLNPSQISRLSNSETLNVTAEDQKKLAGIMARRLKLLDGGYYFGTDPSNPKIGDLRITFSVVKPHQVTIIAQQTGSTFQPYQTKAGDALSMLQSGSHSSKDMFDSAQSSNTMMTWVFRLLGFIMMFIGVKMIFEPLVVVADVVPFFGDVLSYGTGMFAFAIAGFFALLTIAIAWFAYRPLLSIGLLAIAGGIIFMVKKSTGGTPKPPPIPPAAPMPADAPAPGGPPPIPGA